MTWYKNIVNINSIHIAAAQAEKIESTSVGEEVSVRKLLEHAMPRCPGTKRHDQKFKWMRHQEVTTSSVRTIGSSFARAIFSNATTDVDTLIIDKHSG